MDNNLGKPAYHRYAEAVQWKNHQGSQMPTWEMLDETQRNAWNLVARMTWEYPPSTSETGDVHVVWMINDVLERASAIRNGMLRTSPKSRNWSVLITDLEKVRAWLVATCMVESPL